MVGGYHQNVLRLHLFHKAPEPMVKLRKGPGVARGVVPVSVDHIEVHEVHEAKPGEVLFLELGSALHSDVVGTGAVGFRNALPRENVVNFADADG